MVPKESRLTRREYAAALVAAGASAGLAACLDAPGDNAVPTGTDDPSTLPDRQHAWNSTLSRDTDGNVLLPEHHVLLSLDLEADIDASARETTETALRSLERAYEWSNEGLLFTIGYTPTYFERVEIDSPIPHPEALSPQESPAFDDCDALIHLASDNPAVVLEAEEGLFGERDELNGEPVEADLTGIFTRREDERRTGFIGEGVLAEQVDLDVLPDVVAEKAPLLMGFRSGFAESQASEDAVTIREGPFAGGTTQHVSSMDTNLTQWFEQENHFQRVSKMFSPHHATEELVGDVGERLDTTSGLTDEHIEATEQDARQHGVVGHAQKIARAREDGRPLLLRRDFNTVDGDQSGLHFLSLQRTIEAFVRVREAMNGEGLDVPMANNGIRHYLFVNRRGNALLPPRDNRALPTVDSSETADSEK